MTTAARRWAALFAVIAVVAVIAGIVVWSEDDDDRSESETAEFEYEGDFGPEHWGELSPAYTACSDGSAQSPIELTGATEQDIGDIGFDYAESDLNIFNNGHTIEAEYDEGSSIDLDGETYDVVQFHFHAASEHVLDGKRFPMELHIVHSTPEGQLAVVGVFVEIGSENEALAPVFDNIPTGVSEEPSTVEGAAVNLADALPATRAYFHYDGSLTTPPCTEGVSWQMLDTPIQISAGQLEAFTDVVHDNFRPPQPLADRELVHDSASDPN